MTATELKKRAIALAEKTKIDSVTPEEVGQLSNDIVEYIENVEINGSSLGIRKTYTSVSAMEEDSTAPKDDKGVLLRRGMLVNIYNQSEPDSADNGKVFSFQNPGWAFRGTVDAGYATKEELTELEQNVSNNIYYLTETKLFCTFSKNRYFTGREQKRKIIDSSGDFVSSNNNNAISSPVVINEGETLVFSQFTSANGLGYAALYDKNLHLIQGSVVQSNSLTWMKGAVYAMWTIIAGYINDSGSKSLYCYEQSNPITEWEEPKQIVPISAIEDYLKKYALKEDFLNTCKVYQSIDYNKNINNKYISSDGTFVAKNGSRISRIDIDDSWAILLIKEIKQNQNVSGIVAGWFKGDNEFVQSIETANSLEVKQDVIIYMNEKPEDAEYILVCYGYVYQTTVDLYIFSSQYIMNILESINSEFLKFKSNTKVDLNERVEILIGKNKYKRGTGLDTSNQKAIDSNGNIVSSNSNMGVSAPVRIKEGETLVCSNYNTAGYAALYDEDLNPIPGSAVKSDTISWMEGAVYARWTGVAVYFNNPENKTYVYEISQPLSGWIPYKESISEELLPESIIGFSEKNAIALSGDSTSQGLSNGWNRVKAVNPQMGGNYGVQVGGEMTLDTVARIGCVPLVVMPFTLQAGQTEIEVKAISQKLYKPTYNSDTGLINTDYQWAKYNYKTGKQDSYVPYPIHNFFGSISGVLNGIPCTLNFERDGDRVFKLSVSNAFEEDWSISTPTPLLPNNETIRNLPNIILMGTNDIQFAYSRQNDIYGVAGTAEWNDSEVNKNSKTGAENLVDLYRHIRDYSYNPQKFIAVGFFCPQGYTKEFYEYFESLMLNEFGNNFFNARQYLMESGWKEAGYTLTSADIERINNGLVPLCCFGGEGNEGNPHLTTNANIVLAYRVAQRCRELGIYDFDPVMPELE